MDSRMSRPGEAPNGRYVTTPELVAVTAERPLVRATQMIGNVAADRRMTITFVTPFPTSCTSIVVQQVGTYGAPFGTVNFMVESATRFGAVVMCSVASLSGMPLFYIATGT